ncbi:hypothetical protein [Dysgonomonas sp. 511]|uniref:hypothetical protein n=1 Tax=Dysgonomonas sp. 511 TaxID=2302930 RepID=UPI0013D576A7|nr:hypothetical protein [Dysgonomonas sp. 511]NDV78075.1 hypothetical protein [Dysgonomonas sp. 511]
MAIETDTTISNDIERSGGEKRTITLYRITGKSMCPYLRGDGNENIAISAFNPQELTVGTIILFVHQGKNVLHRIIKKENNRLIAQGDGNYIQTEDVKPEDVLGIACTIIYPDGRQKSVNNLKSRIYWRIWYLLRPFRKYLLYIYHRLNK